MRTARNLLPALALLMTTAVAQAEPQISAPGATTFGGSAISTAPIVSQRPRPLATFGNLAVGIWAPVPAPYDVTANRTLADNPQ
ncbi:MAG: hypothetical protein WDN25_18350 [Acetobacteraceae bacterium]